MAIMMITAGSSSDQNLPLQCSCFSARRGLNTILLVACIFIWPVKSGATHWEFQPSVSLSEIFSDNIELQPRGMEQDEQITEVAPSLDAAYNSRKVQANINYRLQSLFYSEEDGRDEVFHQLDTLLQADLPAQFFIEGSARYSQQVVEPDELFTFSNIPVANNQADVAAANLSPYWRVATETGLQTEIRFTGGVVNYDEGPNVGTLEDSDIKAINVVVQQADIANRLTWAVFYNKNEIEFEDSGVNIFEQTSVELGIPLGSRALVFFTAGEEDNEFEIAAAQEPPEGSFWNIGLRWSSPRGNAFELLAGDRFFGEYYRLSWEYSGRYGVIELGYSEDLFTDTQAQFGERASVDGEALVNTSLRPSTGVFLQKRADFELRFRKSRTELRFIAYNEVREFQANDTEDETGFAQLRWDWVLRSRLNFNARYQYRVDDFGDSGIENRLKEARIGFERSFGSRSVADLSIRTADLGSSIVTNEYRENTLQIGFRRDF